ncbi:MAG: TlpA disulfide reductase family protein [Bacteroidales bacterium]
MKKLLVIASVALALASCSSKGYKIEANIEGATNQMVVLKTMQDNELVGLDSVMMTDGKFQFTGSIEVPDIYAIDFSTPEDRLILFLENSNITITGKVDNIMSSDIKGSKTQDLFMEFNKKQEEMSLPLMEIQQKFQTAAMDGSLTPEMEQELREQFMAENDKMLVEVKDFVTKNSTSVLAAYITLTQLANQLSFEELEAIVSAFPNDIQKSPFVIALNEKINIDKLTAIGQPFIDFTHPDADGNMITFSSVTGENYILIDFWAGWCTPCRRENPNLVALYNQYKDKGFDIFGISLDRRKQEWLDAVEEDGLKWMQVSDVSGWDNPVAKMYGVQSIPANLLVGPDGKIIAKNLRGEDLASKLAELLN